VAPGRQQKVPGQQRICVAEFVENFIFGHSDRFFSSGERRFWFLAHLEVLVGGGKRVYRARIVAQAQFSAHFWYRPDDVTEKCDPFGSSI
jgi:hypothetical protein